MDPKKETVEYAVALARVEEGMKHLAKEMSAIPVSMAVGFKELKESINEISTELRSDINDISVELRSEVAELRKDAADKDKRIQALENWKWYVVGMTVAAVFIFEIVTKFVK